MKSVILAAALMMGTVVASAANFGEGYNARLRESREGRSPSDQWVYLNHPSQYRGPGYLAACKKVSTYQGGPRGMWRTYYICRVAY